MADVFLHGLKGLHPLTNTEPTYSYCCDNCRLKRGNTCWHCKICEYDLCKFCYRILILGEEADVVNKEMEEAKEIENVTENIDAGEDIGSGEDGDDKHTEKEKKKKRRESKSGKSKSPKSEKKSKSRKNSVADVNDETKKTNITNLDVIQDDEETVEIDGKDDGDDDGGKKSKRKRRESKSGKSKSPKSDKRTLDGEKKKKKKKNENILEEGDDDDGGNADSVIGMKFKVRCLDDCWYVGECLEKQDTGLLIRFDGLNDESLNTFVPFGAGRLQPKTIHDIPIFLDKFEKECKDFTKAMEENSIEAYNQYALMDALHNQGGVRATESDTGSYKLAEQLYQNNDTLVLDNIQAATRAAELAESTTKESLEHLQKSREEHVNRLSELEAKIMELQEVNARSKENRAAEWELKIETMLADRIKSVVSNHVKETDVAKDLDKKTTFAFEKAQLYFNEVAVLQKKLNELRNKELHLEQEMLWLLEGMPVPASLSRPDFGQPRIKPQYIDPMTFQGGDTSNASTLQLLMNSPSMKGSQSVPALRSAKTVQDHLIEMDLQNFRSSQFILY